MSIYIHKPIRRLTGMGFKIYPTVYELHFKRAKLILNIIIVFCFIMFICTNTDIYSKGTFKYHMTVF